MIDVFLTIIAIIWLIFASISDLKKREVPDWLSYSLISIGFFASLLKSLIFKDLTFIISGLFVLLLFLLIGLLMYYTKQWGGGDVKVIIGLVTLIPNYPYDLLSYFSPNLDMPFILILIINILFIGSLYSIIYGVYLITKNKINLYKEIKNNKINKSYISSAILILIVSFFIKDIILKLMLLLIGFLIVILQYLFIFVNIVEKKCMVKKVNLDEISEGEWILTNIYHKGKLIYDKKSLGITQKQIELLKKLKIKKVLIKVGIPFVPTFLLALITSLIFGNLIKVF